MLLMRPLALSPLVITAALGFGAALIYASDGMTAVQDTPISITGPDGVCKKVTNNSATNLSEYIPTASVAEWQSFVTHPPVGVALATCSGSQTYSTPGTYTFTVPEHTTLTVQVWGAGGGGVGQGASGVNSGSGMGGSASTWGGGVIRANGGTGASGSPVAVGTGGTGIGGTTNTTGGNGSSGALSVKGGGGGDSPVGGAGGSGGICPSNLGGAGVSPGGGGGGSAYSFHLICQGGSGGGAGGYATRTYNAGTYTVGSTVTVVVGSGGLGGFLGPTFTTKTGGDGAAGRVTITWN